MIKRGENMIIPNSVTKNNLSEYSNKNNKIREISEMANYLK